MTRSPLSAETELTLALMAQGQWWHLDPPASFFWQELRRAIGSEWGSEPRSALPAGVIGRPAALPARVYHRNALARLCRATPSETKQLRLAYHAEWLLALLRPAVALDPTGGGPLVSVVIPVFNRADTIAQAVACCLGQTYPHLEILVIDDGSSEDITTALLPVLERIRLLRLDHNRGAGAARNLGISEARGKLVHFLDADDLLEADAIARKVEALKAIPDADLVFSGARQTGLGEHERGQRLRFLEPPTGDEDCPTHNLLAVMATRYPFLTSTVLLPRHLLRETGPFDNALRSHEDTELFFRLALRDIKAIGISGLPTHRRVSGRSLSASLPPARYTARLKARCLMHLAAVPQHWQRYSPKILDELMKPRVFEALALDKEADLPQCRRAVCHVLRRIRRDGDENGTAAAQVKVQLQRGLARLRLECAILANTTLYRDLAALVDP